MPVVSGECGHFGCCHYSTCFNDILPPSLPPSLPSPPLSVSHTYMQWTVTQLMAIHMSFVMHAVSSPLVNIVSPLVEQALNMR